MHKFLVGERFKLTSDALDNYGEKYSSKVFTVRQWFNRHMPVGKCGTHDHPGYDGSTCDLLYEADGLNIAVYGWEMEKV